MLENSDYQEAGEFNKKPEIVPRPRRAYQPLREAESKPVAKLIKLPPEGRQRTIISGVSPEVEGGRFPAKGTIGETFAVEADIFADGHDEIAAVLLWRKMGDHNWRETQMHPLGNDRWRGEFGLAEIGLFEYSVSGWVDPFLTFRRNLQKRLEAKQDVAVDLQIGAELIRSAAARLTGTLGPVLAQWADRILLAQEKPINRIRAAMSPRLAQTMVLQGARQLRTNYHRILRVSVDPARARYSTWYELFPRSCSLDAGRPGTFADLKGRLPHLAGMGFDTIFLPPIHPIGRAFRKGRNNSPAAESGDPGSPWAVGNSDGGHKAVNPELGTLEDFKSVVAEARRLGIEIAMDVSLQASPDHPHVKEHPEWFRKRPDGTIQFAENPPKKYQDIFPYDFECPDWQNLWWELEGIFEYWVSQGVRVFRVDNPHTKPFGFWEWCLSEIKRQHPEVLFLSEAFTRPRVMYRLAQLGFSQSYTYFPWRTTKWELTQYFSELTQSPVKDFYRGSHWLNTPDILTEYLQRGGKPAFIARLVLAGTLAANYGMYGPAFELMESAAVREGSEEYLDSEKYQIRYWDWDCADSLKEFITLVNRIRRENNALQSDRHLTFHNVENEQLIVYSKSDSSHRNVILTVVNLDPRQTQSGWTWLDLGALGVKPEETFQVHDLISDARYVWRGARNYVELNPSVCPAHIFLIRHYQRTENDLDYYE